MTELNEATHACPTDKEFEALGQECDQLAESIEKQMVALRNKPVSLEDYLTGNKPPHGIDFETADKLLAKVDAALKHKPDAVRMVHYRPCPVADFAQMLRTAVAQAEPYRKLQQ